MKKPVFSYCTTREVYTWENVKIIPQKKLSHTLAPFISIVFLPKVERVSMIRIHDPKSLGSNAHKQSVQGSFSIPWNRKDNAAKKAKEEYKFFWTLQRG